MFIKPVMRYFWLISLLLLAACSRQDDPPPVTAPADGKPALWKVTSNKPGAGSAYIFGTVHALPAGTDWQGPALDRAIDDSLSLVTEVTGLDDKQTSAAIFAHMGITRGLPPLDKRVSADLADELDKAAGKIAAPAHAMNAMETWAAALTIASSMSSGLGLNSASGVEAILQMRFKAMDRPHSGLETITQQFGYFDTLPESEQRLMLSAILRDYDDARADMQLLLDRWMRGDVDALLEGTETGIMASPRLRAVLLDNRNRNWAEQAATMIDAGRRPFIAVGAAHVAGQGGLPALLSAKGYRVERIQ
ncbi:TraB/GumN family protein [Sphingorhabdus arenilitoris]|uniref:TraB/GumN family protein n=1 Tax=Sphingorhabdus arenilitoris TaxID=1490041 RepID=A0ABV8RDP4_9SPHN